MSGIFVSYRRGQAAGYAGRIADELARRYGKKAIFRDVEAISAGSDFTVAIGDAVGSCDALLVVITPGWADARNEKGAKRLEDPEDFVRVEIESALARDTWVIPVLVGGATMPSSDELPETIKSLARRQAHEIRDASWEFNVDQLIKTLTNKGIKPRHKPVDTSAPSVKEPPRPELNLKKRVATYGAALALLAVIILAVQFSNRDGSSPSDQLLLDNQGPPPEIEKATANDVKQVDPGPARQQQPSKGQQTLPTRTDPVALYGRDIEATIDRATQVAITAVRELNPQYAASLYVGAAYDSLYSFIEVLGMNGMHAAISVYDRRIDAMDVADDGSWAEVDLIETRFFEFHSNMDDSCVAIIPAFQQGLTLYLERGGGRWLISDADFHNDPPEAEECSAF